MRRRLLFGAVVLSVLALVVFVGNDAMSRVRDVRAAVLAAEADLRRAQPTVQALAGLDGGQVPTADEISGAQESIRSAHVHLERARARFGYLGVAMPVADVLPLADGATEVDQLIDLGSEVTIEADGLLTLMLPLLEPGEEAGEPLALRVRRVFVDQGAELDATLGRLDELRPEVERLRARSWGAWLDAAPGALELLSGALQDVPQARETMAAVREGLDPFFGFDEPKTYLVAGLNESELRATGGFLGTIGVITVEGGALVSSDFERVYSFERELEEYPAPPLDLAATMGATWFLPRDANWWPDFPTSAESLLELFEQHQGVRADGVIALNTLFTGRLVEVFAPLDLDEYPETLLATNWRGVMERTLLAGRDDLPSLGEDVSAEEAYLHPLMEALIARTQSADADRLPALVSALMQGSRARDLQAYASDPAAQAMLDQFGVSGRLAPVEAASTIAVVDSNVSWSKVQPGVSRETTVLIGQDDRVDVTVLWQNRASALDPRTYPRALTFGEIYRQAILDTEEYPGVFGNYVRFYLPAGAMDISVSGSRVSLSGPFPLPHIERGEDFTVVSGLVIVEDGQDATMTVSYTLPSPEAVRIWKQGGQANDRLRVFQNIEGTQHRLYDDTFAADVTVPLLEP